MPDLTQALSSVRSQISGANPKIAVVLGSGLGGLSESVAESNTIPYSEIPGFPEATVTGHAGELILGWLDETPVILQNGRFHLYEGFDPATVALPVRLFAELGIENLIVTNAAGGLNPMLRPPTLMLIADHVNFMWRNPLIGKELAGEPRWPDLSDAYDSGLRDVATAVGLDSGMGLDEGVYAGVLGPCFETPAEVRMLRQLGCDAVGMSTVPEVIAARARGMKVLGISSITNAGSSVSSNPLSHEEVLEAGGKLSTDLERLVRGVIRRLNLCTTST
jgi:purine-nucleoside phosphorylase